jgi:hypothetical protein
MLQKFQRNEIFKAIEAVGLDPGQFDLNYSDSEVRIKHKRSGSYFFIGGRPGHYVGNGIVGDGPDTRYELYSWDPLISRIRLWFQLVKNDLDTPDLWAELQRETRLLGADPSVVTENTLFTGDEQKEIARRLEQAAKYMRETHSLSMAQMRALDEKLDYVIEASTRLGRKDWLNIFIATILGYVFIAALPPESARTIFTTFLRSIGILYPELPLLE